MELCRRTGYRIYCEAMERHARRERELYRKLQEMEWQARRMLEEIYAMERVRVFEGCMQCVEIAAVGYETIVSVATPNVKQCGRLCYMVYEYTTMLMKLLGKYEGDVHRAIRESTEHLLRYYSRDDVMLLASVEELEWCKNMWEYIR